MGSQLTNYGGCGFVNTISVGIPLWDRHVSAETNVEDTLWLCLAVLIAVVVTAAVELVLARQRPGDEIVMPDAGPISRRFTRVLSCYAEGAGQITQRKRIGRAVGRCVEHPGCGEP